MARLQDARCSFCGKRQDEVKRLIAGPGVFICDRCVELCNQIMAANVPHETPVTQDSAGGWIRRALRRPRPPLKSEALA